IGREVGDRSILTRSLFNQALLELDKHNIENGIKLLSEAWQIAVELNEAISLFYIGKLLGEIRLQVGCRDEGLQMLHIAYEAGKSVGLPGIGELKKLLENSSPKKRVRNSKGMR
ncbi:MAG TPA: hypothetical protein VF799_00860, partial [Geobacteraceae bacterium]